MSASNKLIVRGVLALLVATILWGGMFPIAKAVLVSVDSFHLNALRYGVTSLAFLAILALLEGRSALNFEGRGKELLVYGTIGFAGFSLLAYAGLSHAQPEHGAIIMATQPMLAAVVRWLWKGHRPRPFTMGCVAVAFIGVFLVVSKGRIDLLATGTGWGDLLLVLGALSWVIYTIGMADFPGWSPLRYTALSCILGEVAILVATGVAVALGASVPPTSQILGGLVPELTYLILLASIVAVLAWNLGIHALGPLNGVLFINFVPITAFAIGAWRGQHFTAIELAGAAMVVAALLANNLALKALANR